MDLNLFKTISTLKEIEHGDFIYRFHTHVEDGTVVTRVPVNQQLWNHRVICQMYSSARGFVPKCTIMPDDNPYFASIEDAAKKVLK